MKESKSFIVHFYKKTETDKFELIIAAAGVGENSSDAVESAKNAVKVEYPDVLQAAWTAYEHHTKLPSGPIPELMPQ